MCTFVSKPEVVSSSNKIKLGIAVLLVLLLVVIKLMDGKLFCGCFVLSVIIFGLAVRLLSVFLYCITYNPFIAAFRASETPQSSRSRNPSSKVPYMKLDPDSPSPRYAILVLIFASFCLLYR